LSKLFLFIYRSHDSQTLEKYVIANELAHEENANEELFV